MVRERLYIIHGLGPDSVGLVGRITEAVTKCGGNIVDLRQDVLHGLFILYGVVDLSGTNIHLDEFRVIISSLNEEINITLQVDNYAPVARNPEKINMLVILLGVDHTGIISSISQLLGKYSINIEFAQNIGREGVFLMELMTDISACSIPIENVQSTLRSAMEQQGIKTIFQTENVFNKKKRVILFDLELNLMDSEQRDEVLVQTRLEKDTVFSLVNDVTGQSVAGNLEGLPAAIYDAILADLHTTPDTMELIQTLKTMGYVIGLITSASSLYAETLAKNLNIEYWYGIPYEIDDDTRCFCGTIACDFAGINRQKIIDDIVEREKISPDDITVITTGSRQKLSGIHPVLNLGTILNLFNRHTVSEKALGAIIASFGIAQS